MAYFYSGVVSIESQIALTLPNVYKYIFKNFSRTHFKMTNTLFNAKTNVLGISSVTFTNKSLLFLYNTSTVTACHLFPFCWAHTLCCIGNNSMVI